MSHVVPFDRLAQAPLFIGVFGLHKFHSSRWVAIYGIQKLVWQFYCWVVREREREREREIEQYMLK